MALLRIVACMNQLIQDLDQLRDLIQSHWQANNLPIIGSNLVDKPELLLFVNGERKHIHEILDLVGLVQYRQLHLLILDNRLSHDFLAVLVNQLLLYFLALLRHQSDQLHLELLLHLDSQHLLERRKIQYLRFHLQINSIMINRRKICA